MPSPSQLASLKFWPDYSQESSWEKRVKLISYLCCCAGRMRRVTEDGQATPAARLANTFATVSADRVAMLSSQHTMPNHLTEVGVSNCARSA